MQKRLERTGTAIKPEELSLKDSHEQPESLWVKIRDRQKGSFVFGVYYSCLTKGSLLMKPSCSRYKKHPACRPVACLGTSALQNLLEKWNGKLQAIHETSGRCGG